jgi:hypothetical protein
MPMQEWHILRRVIEDIRTNGGKFGFVSFKNNNASNIIKESLHPTLKGSNRHIGSCSCIQLLTQICQILEILNQRPSSDLT